MEIITFETLCELLKRCINSTIDDVQEEIPDPLPRTLYLELAAFDRSGKDTSFEEVMSLLYIDGTFPQVVDIGVKGITKGSTIIWIRPSSHTYVSNISDTWNQPPGMGPFKSIGLILPKMIWDRPRSLSRHDLEDAARGYT
jgi:hypothetical protein